MPCRPATYFRTFCIPFSNLKTLNLRHTHETIFCPVVSYRYEAWVLTFEAEGI